MNKVKRYLSLDGDWEFAYKHEAPDLQSTDSPEHEAYDCKVSVPGYWDDYADRLRVTRFWSRDCKINPAYRRITFPAGTGSPPDTSLPFLVGTGWYKKCFVAGGDWGRRSVVLHVGGVALEALRMRADANMSQDMTCSARLTATGTVRDTLRACSMNFAN